MLTLNNFMKQLPYFGELAMRSESLMIITCNKTKYYKSVRILLKEYSTINLL